MPRRNLAWLLSIVSLTVLTVALSLAGPKAKTDDYYPLMHLLVDVLDKVDTQYEKPLSAEEKRKLVENMVNGGLERLDPHSAYIPPRELKQQNDNIRGQFGGIGVTIEPSVQNQGMLTVISPMPGSPAYKQGIRAGDIILQINGKSTDTLSMRDAVDLIKGKKGEEVTLKVLHEGEREPVEIRIVRDIIKVSSVLGDHRKNQQEEEWEYLVDPESKIALIRLTSFNETSADELSKVLRELIKQDVQGLILDLRDNPGGLLTAAVQITDLFLPAGKVIVSVKPRLAEERQVYHTKDNELALVRAEQVPLVVLLNRNSASASEIVSGALQDHGRAVIVGERSYGKASVQNIIPMENKTSALKLTTARYFRPSDKNIHRDLDMKETDEWGVRPKPEHEVPLKIEERRAYLIDRRDRDIARGEPAPAKEKVPTEPKEQEKEKPKEKTPFVDRVLQKALEVLREDIKKAKAGVEPAKEEQA